MKKKKKKRGEEGVCGEKLTHTRVTLKRIYVRVNPTAMRNDNSRTPPSMRQPREQSFFFFF